ncbi:MAG: hypothetical protein V1742_01305 [Pseudomonadota bacterium]
MIILIIIAAGVIALGLAMIAGRRRTRDIRLEKFSFDLAKTNEHQNY